MKWMVTLIFAIILVGSFALYSNFYGEPTSTPSPPDASQVKRLDTSAQLIGVTEQISTMSGTMSVKRACDSISGCAEVYVNSTQIAVNDLATILGGYPFHKATRWVVYEASSSGNAAPPLPSIVDVSMNPPFVVENLMIQPDTIKLRDVNGVLEVTGKSAFDLDKVGNPTNVAFRLYAESRIAILQPYDAVTPFEKFVNADGGKPASDILADPLASKPLMVALGTHFKTFREHMQVSNPAKLLDHRYIVGEGCAPHLCGSSIGIFIIDVATGRASAAWIDDGSSAHIAGERWRGDKDSAAYSTLADWRSDHDSKSAKSETHSNSTSQDDAKISDDQSKCSSPEAMTTLNTALARSPEVTKKGMVIDSIVGQRSLEEIYKRFFERYDATSQERIVRAGKQPYGMLSPEALALSGRNAGTSGHKVSEYVTPPTPDQQNKDSVAALDRAKKREVDTRRALSNMVENEERQLDRNNVELDCYATAITNFGTLRLHYYWKKVEGQTVMNYGEGSHRFYSDADIEQALAGLN